MDAAVETIAEVGFARASLARIARRAGISKGVISYHFAGKEELMEQIVIAVYTDIGENVAGGLHGVESVTEMVRVNTTRVAEYMRGHRSSLRALGEIFLNLRGADGEPHYGMHTNEPLYQPLEDAFRRGQESGELRDFDTRVMAISYQSALDAMFGYWALNPEWDLTAHAEQVSDLFVRAIRAEAPRDAPTPHRSSRDRHDPPPDPAEGGTA